LKFFFFYIKSFPFFRHQNGFSGLNSVNQIEDPNNFNDRQESFFLSETLKYFFLIFSKDKVIPLNEYVFNTEAHPFPIIKDFDFSKNWDLQ
jgi:hypothetical protein